ncbi:uncharacterized protein LOC127789031 isoform X2 [Diospyros lotus]|uniref:uncharacterized protein LOC127789031 isoform X2 n=1 Tax=Diospyros lotus TaxID=55363 RepID=UPI00224D2C65|nr:uncharacterized protein LOC127789031 isoform X2 [Diospyros lotus]
MELGGEMEGKELLIIEHPSHDHPLVLRESLLGGDGYGGGGIQVRCDGCGKRISSSSSSSSGAGGGGGGGSFYACPNSDCWYLLHKHCAELPPKIEHPCHPEHALILRLHLLRDYYECYVCGSTIDELHYRCSDCGFCVDVRCALMAVHIHDRVDENNRIHQHPMISLEKEAEFLCDACGREHKGKSYLCPTCGFWANQICASGPTTVDIRSHPHPLALFRCFRDDVDYCPICHDRVERASWVYRCSEGCSYLVHVGCPLSEEAENSNSDIQTKLHSESTSHKIEILTALVPQLS